MFNRKAKNDITELVFILDKSGSMHGLEKDTIGGFNSMLEKQRALDGECFITTVLFDDRAETLHDREPLKAIAPMTDRDYTVGGCTALLDALGNAIEHISRIHKYARREDVPEHTIFVIMTDGMENSSKRFTASQVKRMIESKKEAGWEFIFLASNIDAVTTAARYGISADMAVDNMPTSSGVDIAYSCACAAVAEARTTGAIGMSWRKRADEEFNRSKKDK